MNYRGALLLDLDGTLVDTALDFIHILQSMQAAAGLNPTRATTIRNTVSDGASAMIQACFDLPLSSPEFQQKLEQLLDTYQDELGKKAQLFPGFNELISFLEKHHIAWGIVTNKPWRFTQPLLERLNISPSQNVIVCPEHVKNSKPAPEALLLAASKLHLKAEQCLYVGDHIRDIEAAKNANMKSIACAYGYIQDNDDIKRWNADIIINNPKDLEDIVKKEFSLNV